MTKRELNWLCGSVIIFGTAIGVILAGKWIDTAQAIQIIISFVLVLVTAIYVKRTSDIVRETRNQAQEMREQRIMASRPVIIQKAIPTEVIGSGFSDRFEVYNAGNGPAIELEILLLDKEENLIQEQRVTFLRASDTPVEFYPSGLDSRLNSDCYLLCRYQSILSLGAKPSWYQTRLPFKPVKSQSRDYIYVEPGKLEFEEVFEKKSY